MGSDPIGHDFKVSLVVNAYNSARTIRRALDSAVGQTLPSLEIICVDDGSTDATAAIAGEYRGRHPNFRLLSLKSNVGLLSARKAGVAMARGEYLMFLDGDDMLLPEAAAELADLMDARGVDGICFGADCEVEAGAVVVAGQLELLRELLPIDRERLLTGHERIVDSSTMSDATPILSCRNVSIRYWVGDFKNIGLKEWVMRHLTGKFTVREFWADQDVTFSLIRGDMLGIIGTNGAGKSTLLKAIAGIMVPTKGQIIRRGRIAALLELATGFDGDLTVKENAYLRGAMLGYTRAFMDETYKYIIDFAELKEFEDSPFKQLSSGMKARLAFSIASLVEPEILILDEVLSVGDGAFALKSAAKMREIISGGAATILVSHSIAQVRQMCNRVLWLDNGRQIAFGDDVNGVCDAYEAFLKTRQLPATIPSETGPISNLI